jgi:hypothetical protein
MSIYNQVEVRQHLKYITDIDVLNQKNSEVFPFSHAQPFQTKIQFKVHELAS